MDFAKQYQDLVFQTEQLEKQVVKLHVAKDELDKQKSELVRQWIFEGKLLAKTTWDLQRNDGSFNVQTHIQNVPETVKNLRTGWHDFFQLSKGVGLYFDDNTLTLNFSSGAVFDSFVKDAEILIECRNLDTDLKKAQSRVESLQKLQKRLKK